MILRLRNVKVRVNKTSLTLLNTHLDVREGINHVIVFIGSKVQALEDKKVKQNKDSLTIEGVKEVVEGTRFREVWLIPSPHLEGILEVKRKHVKILNVLGE